MVANRRAPNPASYPSGIKGTPFAEDLDAEISALWNYVSMPLTGLAGTANNITGASLVPLIADPVQGQRVQFTPLYRNTGAVTLDVDARGADPVVDADGNALTGDEIRAGRRVVAEFDGTSWRLLQPVKSPWTTVIKRTSQAKTSDATLANDTALTFEMEANRTYAVRIVVFFNAAAAPGFKYALAGPASPTRVQATRRSRAPNATAYAVAGDAAYTGSTSITGHATSHGDLAIDLVIENGANAGTFAFQWAQNTSDGTAVTVRKGSYLEWMPID